MRKISSVLSLILAVCLTIGGVSATWIYATGPIADAIKNFTASMGEWDFGYTVTFINNEKDLLELAGEDPLTWETGTALDLTTNSKAQTAASTAATQMGSSYQFSHWINAGSTRVDSIDANNTEDVTLYPSFVGIYTAIFVDQDGNILAWDTFTTNSYTNITTLAGNTTPPTVEDCTFDYWQVHVKNDNGTITKTSIDTYNFKNADRDITIYPVYTYNGDVNLIPIDRDGDGITDEYQVGGYNNPNGQAMVEIPDYVNGIPITEIAAGAFSSYDGVHSVVIPNTITTVGGNVLATDWSGFGDSGETVTIYYEGSYDEWIALEATFNDGWADGLSASSRIFFLNGGETVDTSNGYLQASTSSSWGTINGISWTKSNITSNLISEYTGYCDCKIPTTGDTGHTYVDASGNVMNHNANGTPVNASGTEIYLKESGWINKTYTLTDGTNTYYRYRPDKKYWDGVTV